MATPEMLAVPVDGGELAVARWGSGATTVLALHGITANHRNWSMVADELAGDDVTVLAPDLRGRGASGALPGPYGYVQHIADVVALLDHVGVDRVVLAGHSMGGLIAVKMATIHPDRLHSLVLVDGGPALPLPADVDVDVLLHAVLGPSMQRLSMTFESPEAYRDYWRVHPALQADWGAALEAYVDYDLTERDGAFVSKVNPEAITVDGRDPLVDTELQAALPTLDLPIRFLWAHRGLMNEDPLYPRPLIEQLDADLPNFDVTYLEDVNHYTIALSEHGAKHLATAIRAAVSEA